jgi:hypothetical protein
MNVKGLKDCVLVFFDDILIHGDTEMELLKNFSRAMLRAQEFNLHFNLSKCLFGVIEVTHLGHILTDQGISMSSDRKELIQSFPIPETRKSLQRFLGMANYFNRFIHNYAIIAAPLTSLTGTSSPFAWNDQAQQAFGELKQAIMDSPSLYFINYDLPLILQVDASVTGVGSILLNYSGSEHRIIQFLSHKFSPQAQRWSTYEQEGYAIYWSILKLQHLLLGHHFTLQTDHRNLLWMEKAAAPKVIRWRLRLQEFDFSIVHIPGKSNIFADYLSRLESKDFDISTVDPIDLIKEVHNSRRGHHGAIRTVKLLLEAGYSWSNMKKDVQAFIKTCPPYVRKFET